MHQLLVTYFRTPSRMVSPWPSFEYFKFVAFLGTDRPARGLYYMGRQMVLFHVLFTATETYENTNKKKTFVHVYNNCQRQSSNILVRT